MLQNGDPNGAVWRPGEADVSIRPGWFYHPAEDARVKTVDDLVTLYFTSAGRNSKLLLNVPPTRQGLLHETDVARLAGMRTRLAAMFEQNLAAKRPSQWRATGATTATLEIDLGRTAAIALADYREPIDRFGQLVSRYTLEGRTDADWRPLASGTTIGCRKIDRFESTVVRRVRLTVETVDAPQEVALGVYGPA